MLQGSKRELAFDVPLVEIVVDQDNLDGTEGLVMDWSVKEVTSYNIQFNLAFPDPLVVSQGDEPDVIILKLNLDQISDSIAST